jgi:hypothetical protein
MRLESKIKSDGTNGFKGELYSYDIQKPQTIVKFPSVQRWGKEIIKVTWNFMLESWFSRNSEEHDLEGDPLGRKKFKN